MGSVCPASGGGKIADLLFKDAKSPRLWYTTMEITEELPRPQPGRTNPGAPNNRKAKRHCMRDNNQGSFPSPRTSGTSPKAASGPGGERLNKWLGRMGICSRREADRLIREGKVYIDGQPALMGQPVYPGQRVEVGRPVGGSGGKAAARAFSGQ